jgi:hypothetical protein
MIAFDAPTNQQGRLVLSPTDSNNDPVTLDENAFTVTVTEDGGGTFEYNSVTNGLVFRPPDSAVGQPVTKYHVKVDGQPGSGESFLELDIEMRAVAVGAVALGESISLESKGTPA